MVEICQFFGEVESLNCVFNLVHYYFLESSELADHLVNEINTCRTTLKLTKW